jgi:hypothetical protein
MFAKHSVIFQGGGVLFDKVGFQKMIGVMIGTVIILRVYPSL